MGNHIYTAEIRIYGRNLDPNYLTQHLDLSPSRFSESSKGINKEVVPFWSYNGHKEEHFKQQWESLEQGLCFLLDCLQLRKEKIIKLVSKHQGVWWCGHFQSSFDGGPNLSPELLKEIASFNLPLFIDNYFSDPSL